MIAKCYYDSQLLKYGGGPVELAETRVRLRNPLPFSRARNAETVAELLDVRELSDNLLREGGQNRRLQLFALFPVFSVDLFAGAVLGDLNVSIRWHQELEECVP